MLLINDLMHAIITASQHPGVEPDIMPPRINNRLTRGSKRVYNCFDVHFIPMKLNFHN